MSFDERERFITEQLPQVIDSATRPLDGDGWWLKADDPWQVWLCGFQCTPALGFHAVPGLCIAQALACCVEIKNALESGDPATFMSSLPVHQDGSCNGLQHYAALGRDLDGGSAVNLTPSGR